MDAATSPRPDVCAADRARRKLRAEANRLCKREGRSAPALPVLFCADCEMFSAVPAFPRTLRDALPLSQRLPRKSRCSCVIGFPRTLRDVLALSALPAHIARLSRRVGSFRANRDAPPRDPAFPRQLPSAALPKESPHIFRTARSAMTAAARAANQKRRAARPSRPPPL